MSQSVTQAMRLTKAQRTFLAEIVRDGSAHCAEFYRPSRRLIELGLARSLGVAYGHHRVEPTAAGLRQFAAAIAKAEGREP